ncbi:hypothetical protein FGIG_12689 [Fasciola gigantica]|uniref:Adenosine deaminase n=1 Tax=Fasciola gigantica TaxID=46835 RepID=A0A504YSH5_FASGI|nr:hypothetical protein FGIG_12689 [Fasciola gigantica]
MNLNEELRGVELHIHLDGAVRADTLYNLALRRNLVGPSMSHEKFRKSLIPTKPYKLANFLEPFKLILLTLAGDKVSKLSNMCSIEIGDISMDK